MGSKAKKSPIIGVAAAALALLAASPAPAADDHLYDPVLSLTGSAAVSVEDPVSDPGSSHPPKSFNVPCGTVTDRHGYIYVTGSPGAGGEGTDGRIDVFDPQGNFLVEIADEFLPCGLAVDSVGNLYVKEDRKGIDVNIGGVSVFEPDSYPPTAATEYGPRTRIYEPPVGEDCLEANNVAVDPSNDHLYISSFCRVEEYGSAAEGWPLIDKEVAVHPEAGLGFHGIDVYGANHDIYVTTKDANTVEDQVLVFDGTDGHLKCEIDGVPAEGGGTVPFDFGLGAPIAVDQSNGDLYVYGTKDLTVDQFAVEGSACPFVGRMPQKPPTLKAISGLGDIAVDSPQEAGEAGYDSPNEGYVYITSGSSAASSHLWAFEPKLIGPPKVREQGAGEITETEAVLEAELSPNALATTYHFEYTTQAAFEEVGYEGATSVPLPDANTGKGGAFAGVSEPVASLEPDTAYRFRLVATNCEDPEADPGECLTLGEGKPGEEGEDATFATYPLTPAGLPDGRAWELVTPPDTNGQIPTMAMLGHGETGIGFDTTLASTDGESLAFGSNKGALPGIGGGGQADRFEALRDAKGWQTHFTGLSGAQSQSPRLGGISPDHTFSFLAATGEEGTLALDSSDATYLRTPAAIEPSLNCSVDAEPEGGLEWIGCGSLGADPWAHGKWISPDGEHVIFETHIGSTAQQLEPCAPSTGVPAIYDRTPGGETRCVSLLPGDVTPPNGATYEGVSADGGAVAFTVAGTLYVRRDNAETLIVASGNPTFGGLSADGERAFYTTGGALGGGDIFACDIGEGSCAGPEAQEPIQIGSGGESTMVNVSADGSAVYFVSPVVLSGEEENGHGAKAQVGEENLYAWNGETVSFIATVSELDVEGGPAEAQALGRWLSQALSPSPGPTAGAGNDPSRTTPDGSVLLFQSHEDLTGHESEGHPQVFRYEATAEPAERLTCLSCNPSGSPATSDARLESLGNTNAAQIQVFPPISPATRIANVTVDGQRAFFQSGERLVAADIDGYQDVYGWRAQGTGGCKREAGCLALISGGKSASDDYLYAMTPNGSDVFFLSGDTLVPQDPDKTPSIYDARVGGGFPPPKPPPGDCLGEICQPAVQAPNDATPATSSHVGPGNPKQATKSRCPKGKRKVRRAGKTRCVKRQTKKAQRKSHDNRRAQR